MRIVSIEHRKTDMQVKWTDHSCFSASLSLALHLISSFVIYLCSTTGIVVEMWTEGTTYRFVCGTFISFIYSRQARAGCLLVKKNCRLKAENSSSSPSSSSIVHCFRHWLFSFFSSLAKHPSNFQIETYNLPLPVARVTSA